MTTSAQEGATSSIDFALEGRLFPAVAVHGSQALVFGGQAPGRNGELFLDAAILDAGTSQWATIPQAPFEEPLYQPAAVAVDRGFVVVGVRCSEDASEPGSSVALCNPGGYAAARYDLSTSSWERLPDMRPPDPEGGGGALAIGSVAGAPYFIADGVVSHFDADAGWIDVARPSVNLERFCATSAGLLGVTLPDSYDLGNPESRDGPIAPTTPAFEPPAVVKLVNGTWSEPIPVPRGTGTFGENAPSAIEAGCTAAGLVVFVPAEQEHPTAVLYDAVDESWRQVEAPPPGLGVSVPSLAIPGGGSLLLESSGPIRFDVAGTWQAAEQWTTSGSPDRAAMSTDGVAVVALRTADGTGTVFEFVTAD